MKYKISKKAIQDIENIWLYTFENWSAEQADRYYNLIIDEIEFIASKPLSGKDYSHVRRNYRCSRVKSHLIFYRVSTQKDEVEIVRVLHLKMDLENRINED